jgi:aspartate racemase
MLRLGAAALADLGAGAIAIPCNTAHYWADDVRAASGLPLIDIVSAAFSEARREERVAVLATRGTIAANIYAERVDGPQVIMPSEQQQQLVDQVIGAIKGGNMADGRRKMTVLADDLLGVADRLVLACTELPVAAGDMTPQFIDPTAALARACVRWWQNACSIQVAA